MSTGVEKDGTSATPELPVRQPAWLIGLMAGLAVAAVVCLALGWWHRTPDLPLGEDFSSLGILLWRTTFIVGGVLVLMALYLAVGQVHRQGAGWRTKFAGYTTPALLVLVVAALMAQGRGTIETAFHSAAEDQMALHPFAVTVAARSAWWFACLALGGLAVLSGLAYRSEAPESAPRPLLVSRWLAVAVAVLVAAACTIPAVLYAKASPFHNDTAERIDPPTLTGLTGEVAYRAEVNAPATYIRPGGAGWVHVADGPEYRQETVEGYDGATGQRRWTFSVPRFSVSEMRTTGIGPDSVVLVKSYIPTDAMLALDATTGALLWTRVDHDVFDEHYPLASRVLLFDQRTADDGSSWTAVAARTGKELWTKTFRSGCRQSMRATDSFFLLRTCDDGPDVIAHVLDAETGDEHGVITAESLGVPPRQASSNSYFDLGAAAGDRVIVPIDSARYVVDAAENRVVARVPDGHNARFVDAESLMLTPSNGERGVPQPVSIYDLRSGKTIDTGLVSGRSDWEESWGPIARVGDQWLTLLSDAPLAEQSPPPPMQIVSTAGPTRTLPNPCEGRLEAVPWVSRVPGAVLVVCGRVDAIAAVR